MRINDDWIRKPRGPCVTLCDEHIRHYICWRCGKYLYSRNENTGPDLPELPDGSHYSKAQSCAIWKIYDYDSRWLKTNDYVCEILPNLDYTKILIDYFKVGKIRSWDEYKEQNKIRNE